MYNYSSIRTKEKLWNECRALNYKSIRNPFVWSKIITGSIIEYSSSYYNSLRICRKCNDYTPLTCNVCYQYVIFVSRHAPDITNLREYLSSIKQYHLNKKNEDGCYTLEDYEKD